MKKMKSVLTYALIATTSLSALTARAADDGMGISPTEWSLERDQAVTAALASDKPIFLNTSIRNKATSEEIFMQCTDQSCNEFIFVKRVPETGKTIPLNMKTFTRQSLYQTADAAENSRAPNSKLFTGIKKWWAGGEGLTLIPFVLPVTAAIVLFDTVKAPFKIVGNLTQKKVHKKEGKELKELESESISLDNEKFVNLCEVIANFK